ncbi:MAG TPA: UbiA-like polyprenyltransferase [Pirellulaceae bacterium]|nr:UbiA-like polyprenyltransferase [Pirellulaceae bacterium]
MFDRVRHLLEMIRFSHTIFALPFALLAAVMAWHLRGNELLATWSYNDILALRDESFPPVKLLLGAIRWQEVVGILICMIGARSAAMAFNRLADYKLDAGNPRTMKRHIPAGVLSLGTVIVFTLVSTAIFFAGTLLFLPNKLPVILSVPVFLFLLGYSYTKRFTSLAHFWLGAALMLAPICAWIALRGEIVMQQPSDILPAMLLGGMVLLWVAGFDIIYACQDYEFDKQAQLRSIPTLLGVAGALRLAAICHLAMIGVLIALPLACPQLGFGWIYGLGVGAVAVLLAYEHSLVRADDLTRVNVAFFHVNAIVSIGLLVVCTLDLLL